MYERLTAHVLELPELSEWSALRSILERPRPDSELLFWKYPWVVARAVGDAEFASYPSASMLCLSLGIQLVDDLLDGDLGGVADGLSPGRAANLAVALHLAAHRIVCTSPTPRERRESCMQWVSSAGLGTSKGQELETVEEADDEASYWRIVREKSRPLVATGCALGGAIAGADDSTVSQLADLGGLLGEVIQVQDDLADALAQPRQQDWVRPTRNLPILYAMTADHADRERFVELLGTTGQPSDLAEAQRILSRSGAVAYCIYHVVHRFRLAWKMAQELTLDQPQILLAFLRRHVEAVEDLLRRAGLKTPEQLWETG